MLARLPVHQAHNLTFVDRAGAVLTAYLAPDRAPIFRPSPAATNHQDGVEWSEHARATRTVERQRYILGLLENPATMAAGLVAAFRQPPLYSTAYARHRGTLYTATYRPVEGRVEYRWPDSVRTPSFEAFAEGAHAEVFAEGLGAQRAR